MISGDKSPIRGAFSQEVTSPVRVDPAILEPRLVSAQAVASFALLTLIVLTVGVASMRTRAAEPRVIEAESSVKVLGMKDRFASIQLPVNGSRPKVGDRIALFVSGKDAQRLPVVAEAWVERSLPEFMQIFVTPVDALFLRDVSQLAPLSHEVIEREGASPYASLLVRDRFRLQAAVGPDVIPQLEDDFPASESERPITSAAEPADVEAPAAIIDAPVEAPPSAGPAESIVWLSGTGAGFIIGEDGSITPTLEESNSNPKLSNATR
ncbi:MAG: hypothetical protein IT290_06435 [Deltaproteobacteria bacterium]|nr:hypothetical protein [Deltaproteobacteria bacterium]